MFYIFSEISSPSVEILYLILAYCLKLYTTTIDCCFIQFINCVHIDFIFLRCFRTVDIINFHIIGLLSSKSSKYFVYIVPITLTNLYGRYSFLYSLTAFISLIISTIWFVYSINIVTKSIIVLLLIIYFV